MLTKVSSLLQILTILAIISPVYPIRPNRPGRPTIVIHPAHPDDEFLGPFKNDILRFLVSFAKKVIGKDNLVMLTQYENFGRISRELPKGVCLPTQAEDIWLRDCTTAGMSKPVKFQYQPDSIELQESYIDSMKGYGITPYVKKSDLIVDGGGIVDNDRDTVIVTTRLQLDNPRADIKGALRRLFGYPNVVVIDEMEGDTTGHSDGMVSFIDTNVVAMSELEEEEHIRIYDQLRRQLPSHIKLVELPNYYYDEYWRGSSSACGMHINALVTDDYIYVPTYGQDRENRKRGHTPKNDKRALKVIRRNTRKTIVPVPVPHKICRMGGSVRCLTLQLKGPIADKLVTVTQKHNSRGG